MIILYEWRDLIENDDYLVALQALAILQVSCSLDMYQKVTYASPVSIVAVFNIVLADVRDIWNPKNHPTEI